MNNDGIDASLGLAFSLELFKRYQKSGVLQAEIPRMPGVRGRCRAYLSLVNGLVVSVYVEDKQGKRYSSDKDTLCRLDEERGPYEWKLLPQPADSNPSGLSGQFQSSFVASPPSSLPHASVPRVVSALPWNVLSTWTPQQRDALYLVLTTINGKRTVETIQTMVQLPAHLVDELLLVLLKLNVIIISAY